jgi:L-glutamine-phosphate cytidylyltransferase
MRVLILAAGRGSRMHAFTEDRPKGLIELAGRPLLERQIEALRTGGCDQIGIVTGYRGDQLRPYADRIFDNPHWAGTNMVRSLCCADAWLREHETLVSYADIVVSPATVAALAASPSALAISYDPGWLALWSARFDDPLSDAESFMRTTDGRLLEIGARVHDLARIQGQYMGLLRITPHGWEQISGYVQSLPAERLDRLDMTSLLSALVGLGTRVDTVAARGAWIEVDSGEDLTLYHRMLADGRLRLE